MQAAWYAAPGPAREVLTVGEVPTPEPQAGEVRVRLYSSGVNPSDVKSRAGAIGRNSDFERIIPHSDGAGVIDKVGDAVSARSVGDRVWVYNAQFLRPNGTAAEYVVLPEALTVPLPDSAGFEVGACIGIPVITAYQAAASGGPVDGKTVLVTGGAGAVGHYAVQIARLQGATVIATVSSPEKAAHAESGGAQHTINYRSEDVVARITEITDGRGVDLAVDVDTSANAAMLAGAMAPYGTIASYGASNAEAMIPVRDLRNKNVTLRFVLMYALNARELGAAIGGITEMLEKGALQHAIAARYPLSEIAAAHEAVEQGTAIGNVVLDIG